MNTFIILGYLKERIDFIMQHFVKEKQFKNLGESAFNYLQSIFTSYLTNIL